MSQFRLLVSSIKSTHQGDGSSGLSVTKRMRKILDRPGILSCEMGGQTLRELYNSRSSSFDPRKLTYFRLCCYLGDYDKVIEEVESGDAPDLEETETPSLLELVRFPRRKTRPQNVVTFHLNF
ncbi:hypothetical protein DFS33DRAFT_1379389 [Desarmillaria ectypa]|nr:hypothetical protein DFS33DRAFT_1379389 [Desarmillaria ectypa]